MKNILNYLFCFLKFILLIGAFMLVLFGILTTYNRLDKPLSMSWDVFLPFALVFIALIINLIGKQKQVNSNFLYNFTSVVVFSAIIFIGYRAKFDTNMTLYYKYKFDYNLSYFSDNISSIQIMLYTLFASNVFLMLTGKKKSNKIIAKVPVTTETKSLAINKTVSELTNMTNTIDLQEKTEVLSLNQY